MQYFIRWAQLMFYLHWKKAVGVMIAIVLAVLIFGCSATSRNVIPAEPGVGYCWWVDAPDWMAKDFINGVFGLMDGFKVILPDGTVGYGLKIDSPDDGIDGECDHVALILETDEISERKEGYSGPLVSVAGSAPCEQFEDIKNEILKDD